MLFPHVHTGIIPEGYVSEQASESEKDRSTMNPSSFDCHHQLQYLLFPNLANFTCSAIFLFTAISHLVSMSAPISIAKDLSSATDKNENN